MSLPKTLNGSTVTIPTVRETGWGNNVTGILATVCDLLSAAVTLLRLKVQRISSPFQAVTASGGATSIDLSAGHNIKLTLNASTTLTLNNAEDGTRYLLFLQQDATGGRTITWPAAVKWRGAAPPTLTAAANSRDVVALMFHGSDAIYLGEYGLNFG